MIERFHYLTYDIEGISHAELARWACKAGVRWVQFRSKTLSGKSLLDEARDVKKVTDTFNARCIINDYVGIAAKIDAAGVHLGKQDMSPIEARGMLGKNKIIGGTANSEADLENLIAMGLDYAGVGPYRYTDTKLNLSPLLGAAGLQELTQVFGGHIPIIAIGGVLPVDVPEILRAGAYGIAASGAAHAIQCSNNIRTFLKATKAGGDDAQHCR